LDDKEVWIIAHDDDVLLISLKTTLILFLVDYPSTTLSVIAIVNICLKTKAFNLGFYFLFVTFKENNKRVLFS
jgi:hypothetical protein